MILFYGDFIVKLAWRLFGNLIYHVFLIKTRSSFKFKNNLIKWQVILMQIHLKIVFSH